MSADQRGHDDDIFMDENEIHSHSDSHSHAYSHHNKSAPDSDMDLDHNSDYADDSSDSHDTLHPPGNGLGPGPGPGPGPAGPAGHHYDGASVSEHDGSQGPTDHVPNHILDGGASGSAALERTADAQSSLGVALSRPVVSIKSIMKVIHSIRRQ